MAMQGCLGKTRLFVTAQGCLRRNKAIHGKTTLFRAKQPYPRRNKVIQGKQGCLPENNVPS
jgi:hypothetical protein